VRKGWDDVVKVRREAVLKPIDEAAGSLIINLDMDAMLQRME
jgi:hypothetical protein